MYRTLRVTAIAGLLLLTAACAKPGTGTGGWPADTPGREGLGQVPATDLGFVRHADAVDFPGVSDWVPENKGLRTMLPLGECVLAVGSYQNGYRSVGANWTGPPTCDRLRLDPAPDGSQGAGDGPPAAVNGWAGGGIGGDALLVEPAGTILAASSDGLHRYRDGRREDLARVDLSTEGFEGQGFRSVVRGMVRTGGGRIIVNADLTGTAGPPTVLVSDDNGASVRRVELPAPAGHDPADRQLLAVLAAAGDTVVAIGYGWDHPGAWRSTDGGRTWAAATIDGLPQQLLLTQVVRAGSRWLAFGGVERTGEQDSTFVLTSADGLHWEPGPVTGLGAGRVTGVTVDRSGTVIMTGSIDDSRKVPADQRRDYCGVVWLSDLKSDGSWRRGELGCSESPPQAIATLLDGRVLIAGNRDLWLRASPVL